MSTLEEFEAAPVGATARSPYRTVVKTELSFAPWVDEAVGPNGKTRIVQSTSDQLVRNGFTLDPAPAAPTSAREALDLAWELAHPIKIGQTIPDGTEYLRRWTNDATPATYPAHGHIKVDSEKHVARVRTLDPLPEPEPDWLDAPAVLASTAFCDDRMVWTPERDHEGWSCDRSRETRHWSDLRDVTPLWPKEDAAHSFHHDEPWCTWLGGEPA